MLFINPIRTIKCTVDPDKKSESITIANIQSDKEGVYSCLFDNGETSGRTESSTQIIMQCECNVTDLY